MGTGISPPLSHHFHHNIQSDEAQGTTLLTTHHRAGPFINAHFFRSFFCSAILRGWAISRRRPSGPFDAAIFGPFTAGSSRGSSGTIGRGCLRRPRHHHATGRLHHTHSPILRIYTPSWRRSDQRPGRGDPLHPNGFRQQRRTVPEREARQNGPFLAPPGIPLRRRSGRKHQITQTDVTSPLSMSGTDQTPPIIRAETGSCPAPPANV